MDAINHRQCGYDKSWSWINQYLLIMHGTYVSPYTGTLYYHRGTKQTMGGGGTSTVLFWLYDIKVNVMKAIEIFLFLLL